MTLGLYSYTKDPRIAAIHRSNSEDWVLEMRNTQPEDAGNNQSILTSEISQKSKLVRIRGKRLDNL